MQNGVTLTKWCSICISSEEAEALKLRLDSIVSGDGIGFVNTSQLRKEYLRGMKEGDGKGCGANCGYTFGDGDGNGIIEGYGDVWGGGKSSK
jgi:hypothetical protein